MKLQVRRSEQEGAPYQTQILVLTDEDGVPLPLQHTIELKMAVNEAIEITVTFLVDGEDIRMNLGEQAINEV